MTVRIAAIVSMLVAALAVTVGPAAGQKQGGTLELYHRDNRPSVSVHEEATVSVQLPFMAL
jgi:peptide/nickel transport system substrate-binding protein